MEKTDLVKISSAIKKGVYIVACSGKLVENGSTELLAETLRDHRKKRHTLFLIDLSEISRMDSNGLGVLVRAYVKTLKLDGDLKLLKPNRRVAELLHKTSLDKILIAFGDEDTALRSFRTKRIATLM